MEKRNKNTTLIARYALFNPFNQTISNHTERHVVRHSQLLSLAPQRDPIFALFFCFLHRHGTTTSSLLANTTPNGGSALSEHSVRWLINGVPFRGALNTNYHSTTNGLLLSSVAESQNRRPSGELRECCSLLVGGMTPSVRGLLSDREKKWAFIGSLCDL